MKIAEKPSTPIMKSTKFALLFSVVALALVSRAQAQVGLLAAYPFDGNANDVSGNGNNGTPVNGPSYASHGAGSALLLNGNVQYISLPAAISNYQDMTVSFWIKTSQSTPDAFNQSVFLVSRDIPNVAYDWNICMGQGAKIEFHTGAATGDTAILTSAQDVNSNIWVHVACIADSAGNAKRIFLNGVQNVSSSWQPHPFENNSVPIFVGASTTSTSSHLCLNGQMDDLRFYNRALTAPEIAQLAATECPPHAATATAVLYNGFVVGATITDAGCGYTNAPAITITGGGGTGATAYAEVSNGSVVNIVITDAGRDYTTVPSIRIASPPFTPWLTVGVSTVEVVQHVVLGKTYALESSFNMKDWVQQGTNFTADSEVITNLFSVSETGKFFRIRQVP